MTKKKPKEELEGARIGLAKRLGIPVSKLKNPRVRKLFDEHFEACRKLLAEEPPIMPMPARFSDSSVGQCTVGNRNRSADPYQRSR